MTLVLSNFKENWTSRTIEKKNFQILCLLLFTILSVSYNLYSIYTIYMKHIDIIFSFGICCELFWWWIILFGFKKKEYFPIIREIMVYYTNGILVINSYSKSSVRFWRSILIHFFFKFWIWFRTNESTWLKNLQNKLIVITVPLHLSIYFSRYMLIHLIIIVVVCFWFRRTILPI